jgi:nucleotide-binding universal stress UspA family protein
MPTRLEHIACFVDESGAARRGLAEAQRLRGQLHAEQLSVVHLIAPPVYYGVYYPPRDTTPPPAPDWLEPLVAEAPGAQSVVIDSFSSYPPAEAVRWAGEARADLLVAASHRGVFRRLVLGSFASYLAYHAPCPVLLVPPRTPLGESRQTA